MTPSRSPQTLCCPESAQDIRSIQYVFQIPSTSTGSQCREYDRNNRDVIVHDVDVYDLDGSLLSVDVKRPDRNREEDRYREVTNDDPEHGPDLSSERFGRCFKSVHSESTSISGGSS